MRNIYYDQTVGNNDTLKLKSFRKNIFILLKFFSLLIIIGPNTYAGLNVADTHNCINLTDDLPVTVTSTAGTHPTMDYVTLAEAVIAINAGINHSGTIICSVKSGYTETVPSGGIAITATGTASNPIVFTKSGIGANPVFTAFSPQPSGQSTNSVIKIIGGDYITIEGFTLLENPLNTVLAPANSNTMTEFGVGLFYASVTDGAQHCSIRNCTIDLNKNYLNSVGIYSNSNHNSTSSATLLSATTTSGSNSYLSILGNVITDVNNGIIVCGSATADAPDDHLVIGGSVENANTISDFGKGYYSSIANIPGLNVDAILLRNVKNFDISYNSISSNGTMTVTVTRAIYVMSPNVALSGAITNTISNNDISVITAATTSVTCDGINVETGSANLSATLNIDGNNFHDWGNIMMAASINFTFIRNGASADQISISNNSFTNLSLNVTGMSFIRNANTVSYNHCSISNNAIVGQYINIGSGNLLGIQSSAIGTDTNSINIDHNNLSNVTTNGNFDGISLQAPTQALRLGMITHNTITNINTEGQFSGISLNNAAAGSIVSENIVGNIHAGNVFGGIILGLGVADCFNNSIYEMASDNSGDVTGLNVSIGSHRIFNNKIYNLTNTSTTGRVIGINVFSATALSFYNNLIANLNTPVANVGNDLFGIHIGGQAQFGTLLFANNTVYLNGASSGTQFSSNAIYASTNQTVTLLNNIFVNNYTSSGSGPAVAYKRSSNNNATYTGISNNNLFYAPVVYSDGTTNYSLADYKSLMVPRETNSISENLSFLSTSGTSPDFLHINPDIQTAIESGGVSVANVTVDYDGDARNTVTPDIGADEGNFIRGITIWNGSSWNNGPPAFNMKAVIEGSYTSTGSIEAQGLDINTNGEVIVSPGDNFKIATSIKVLSGNLVFENNANLIQIDNTANTGNITISRNASMRRLDYTYWSSPVAGQNLKLFSPMTVSPPVGASRFYTINETTNNFEAVDPLLANFAPAVGYSIRAPNDFPNTPALFTGIFTGNPHNGNISIPVTHDTFGFNLIGNPYPSTISAQAFLDGNASISTLYFWTHTLQGSASGANYATFNATGQTAASATTPASAVPNGMIQVAQGFMVETNAPATVSFLNSMRVANNDNQFFRNANAQKHRIWLNLSDTASNLNQILVGYIADASNAADFKYDGKLIETQGGKLYNIINNEKYVIQGRALPFENTDTVPLGFTTEVPGSFSIALDHADGLFSGDQDIFIKDNLTGITHNIKLAAYTFASDAGTFDNRFEVVYQNAPLGTENPVPDAESVVLFKQNGILNINSGTIMMQGIKIFDVRGRLIYEKNNIGSSTAVLNDLKAEQQVLLVQVSADHKIITKKVVY